MNPHPKTVGAAGGRRQIGAALFVSLVFLLILTVIGLSGMQNSSLQEKMASHHRERHLAFQAAESAIKAGETRLAQSVPAFVCDVANDGLYNHATPGATTDCPASKGWPSNSPSSHAYPPDQDAFWQGNTDVIPIGVNTQQYDKLADSPKYVIEALSSGVPGAAVSLEAGIPVPPSPKFYRITARGVGLHDSAVVVTQSVVRQ